MSCLPAGLERTKRGLGEVIRALRPSLGVRGRQEIGIGVARLLRQPLPEAKEAVIVRGSKSDRPEGQ